MPASIATDSGSASVAAARSRSARVTGEPTRSRSAATSRADVAAIEIVEPGMGELFERRGERALPQRRAGRRRLAVDQEGLRKAGNELQLGERRR